MDAHEFRERFTIRISERGLEIQCRDGGEVALTASEALMLLDMLKSEEANLTQLAEASSPLPMRISLQSESGSSKSETTPKRRFKP